MRLLGCAQDGAQPKALGNAGDAGAAGGEFLFDGFVAAVEMVDPADGGLAFSREGGQDEGDGGAQVGRHDGSAGETLHAADDGRGAMRVDFVLPCG